MREKVERALVACLAQIGDVALEPLRQAIFEAVGTIPEEQCIRMVVDPHYAFSRMGSGGFHLYLMHPKMPTVEVDCGELFDEEDYVDLEARWDRIIWERLYLCYVYEALAARFFTCAG